VSWNVYLISEKILVPTSVKTVAGFYLEVDPVFVGRLEDARGSAGAIASALESGNVIVPTPDWRRNKSSPVVLRPAGVRNWPTFVKRATCWRLSKGDQSYMVVPCRRMEGHAAWEEDRERGLAIPDNLDVAEVSRRVLEVIRSFESSQVSK
jgi:hypothetical protein